MTFDLSIADRHLKNIIDEMPVNVIFGSDTLIGNNIPIDRFGRQLRGTVQTLLEPSTALVFQLSALSTEPKPGDVMAFNSKNYIVIGTFKDPSLLDFRAIFFEIPNTFKYAAIDGTTSVDGFDNVAAQVDVRGRMEAIDVDTDFDDGTLDQTRVFVIEKPTGLSPPSTLPKTGCEIEFEGLTTRIENIEQIRSSDGELVAWRLRG